MVSFDSGADRESPSKNLPRSGFDAASAFVDTTPRPVDRALFDYHFEDGSAASVLDELGEYQNPDGGFGHGMEPDFRLGASSPMATSVGLQYCTAVDAKGDDPLVRQAVEYLVDSYESDGGYWPQTPPEVNDEPHAPWWHVETVEPPPEEDWANPSAEIVGYLHRFSNYVPEDFLREATERARENVARRESLGGWYRYNLLCWQRALPHLPKQLAATVEQTIEATFDRFPPTDENYGEVDVVALAPSPSSILARHAPETVEQRLDEVIDRQAPDGGWWPTWEWGQYEEAWEVAKREWAGKLTVETLHVLDAHSRLA